jgi:hypothetical protein
MHFLPNGPDIPDDLVALQEKGQTIFVCGAGVSRTIGLPLFHEVVEGVCRELGEDWSLRKNLGQRTILSNIRKYCSLTQFFANYYNILMRKTYEH